MNKKPISTFLSALLCLICSGCGSSANSSSQAVFATTTTTTQYTFPATTTTTTTKATTSEPANSNANQYFDSYKNQIEELTNKYDIISIFEPLTGKSSTDKEGKLYENYEIVLKIKTINIKIKTSFDPEGLCSSSSDLYMLDPINRVGDYYEIKNSYKKNKNLDNFQSNLVDSEKVRELNKLCLSRKTFSLLFFDKSADLQRVDDVTQKILDYIYSYTGKIDYKKSITTGETFGSYDLVFKYNDDCYIYLEVETFDHTPVLYPCTYSIVTARSLEETRKTLAKFNISLPEPIELTF